MDNKYNRKTRHAIQPTINFYSIWDELVNGFDIPFEVDQGAGGGRARGWKSRVRKRRLPNSLKDAYDLFVRQVKNAQLSLTKV